MKEKILEKLWLDLASEGYETTQGLDKSWNPIFKVTDKKGKSVTFTESIWRNLIGETPEIYYKRAKKEISEAFEDKNRLKIQEEREKTFGEKLVGLDFNPSGNSQVTRAKQLCAELADLVNDNYIDVVDRKGSDYSSIRQRLYQHSIGEILNAQMNVVKMLTF